MGDGVESEGASTRRVHSRAGSHGSTIRIRAPLEGAQPSWVTAASATEQHASSWRSATGQCTPASERAFGHATIDEGCGYSRRTCLHNKVGHSSDSASRRLLGRQWRRKRRTELPASAGRFEESRVVPGSQLKSRQCIRRVAVIRTCACLLRLSSRRTIGSAAESPQSAHHPQSSDVGQKLYWVAALR